MKNILLIAATGLLLSACNNKDGKTSNAPVPAQEKTTIKLADLATPKDLVCEMDLSQDAIADTALVDGKIYGFCNVGCKQEFLQNKAKYVK